MSAAQRVVVDVIAERLHGQDVLAAGPTWTGVDDSRAIGVRDEWTPSQAEERTAAIVSRLGKLQAAAAKVSDLVSEVYDLLEDAWTMRAHLVLGFPSFEAYCAARFGDLGSIRLPDPDQERLVLALTGVAAGERRCSVRGASRLMGISDETGRRRVASALGRPIVRTPKALPAAPEQLAVVVGEVVATGDAPARSVTLLTLDALAAAGPDGLTIPEAVARLGRSYGSVSGALSALEAQGHAAREGELRGTFSPYVLADHLA